MKGLQIIELKEAREDDRGKTFDIALNNSGAIMYNTRKQDTISGRHYHTGKIGKNPEVILLLTGIVEVYAKDLNRKEEIRIVVNSPAKIEVFPFVWHEVKALTDITFLELSSLEQHKQDTIKEMPA